jgi:succinoglycan biosynthesis transport protein ExoP
VELLRDSGSGAPSSIIQLTVTGGDPDEIAAFTAALMKIHLKNSNSLYQTGLSETIQYVREQKDKAERDLKKKGSELQRFKVQYPDVDRTSAERAEELKELLSFEAEARQAAGDLAGVRKQIASVKRDFDREPEEIKVPRNKENPDRVDLESQLRKVRADLDAARLQYRPNSPEYKLAAQQVESLERQVKATSPFIKVDSYEENDKRKALQTQLHDLEIKEVEYSEKQSATAAALEAARRAMPRDNLGPIQMRLTAMQQDYDRVQLLYNTLGTRLQDLEMRQNSQIRAARIIEMPNVPRSPIAPRKETMLLMSAVLSLLLATALTFLAEFLDDRINMPSDIERHTGLPALGNVPLIPAADSALISDLPTNSHFIEAYRGIRSAIGFAGMDAPIRRLQITSAMKGEGKTLSSVNTATAMAMDGKRVILVDADLRRPNVHRLLGIPASPGLTEVLVGRVPLEEALQDTATPNLRVLPAGSIPPNPPEMLGSRAFEEVMETLEEMADVVIFDTPPCIPVTDPLIVAPRMDGVLVVLHAGTTRRGALKHVVTALSRARARVLGVVFNQVQEKNAGYYSSYYYYYRRDGYYGDNSGGRQTNGKAHKPLLGNGSTASTAGSDQHGRPD